MIMIGYIMEGPEQHLQHHWQLQLQTKQMHVNVVVDNRQAGRLWQMQSPVLKQHDCQAKDVAASHDGEEQKQQKVSQIVSSYTLSLQHH